MYGASSSRGVSGVGGGWWDAAGELAEEPVVEEGVLACGWASWIDIVVSVDGKNYCVCADRSVCECVNEGCVVAKSRGLYGFRCDCGV